MHALIHHVVRQQALDAPRARSLWDLSGLHAPPPSLERQLRRGLIGLVGLLLGAALVCWVAANWELQSRLFKLHLLQAALALPTLAALAWPRVRTAALLAATLALGALLAYVGQTWQTGADAWQLFAAWALLALPWMLVARRDLLWALWTVIVAIAIVSWSGDGPLDLGRLLQGPRGVTLLWAVLHGFAWALEPLRLVPPGRPALVAIRLTALLALTDWVVQGIAGLTIFGHASSLAWWLSALLVAGTGLVAWRRRVPDVAVLGMAVLAGDVLLLAQIFVWLWTGLFHLERSDVVAMLLVMTVASAAIVWPSGAWLLRLSRAVAQRRDPPDGAFSDASGGADAAAVTTGDRA